MVRARGFLQLGEARLTDIERVENSIAAVISELSGVLLAATEFLPALRDDWG